MRPALEQILLECPLRSGGLCVCVTPLAQEEISLCVVITTRVCQKPHMCGKSHTDGSCIVCGFSHTYVGKPKHVWEQPHVLLKIIFFWRLLLKSYNIFYITRI